MTSRSERRVSVRLVATGGQALKAELVGIGQEGARALTLIEAAGPKAAAGLNATVDMVRVPLDSMTYVGSTLSEVSLAAEVGGIDREIDPRREHLTGGKMAKAY